MRKALLEERARSKMKALQTHLRLGQTWRKPGRMMIKRTLGTNWEALLNVDSVFFVIFFFLFSV